jgi:hypothetical protein
MHLLKHIWIHRFHSELIYNERATEYFHGLVALLIQMPCYTNHTFPYSGTLILVTLLCPSHTKRIEGKFDMRMWWVALRPSPCWRNIRLCLRAYFTVFLGICRHHDCWAQFYASTWTKYPLHMKNYEGTSSVHINNDWAGSHVWLSLLLCICRHVLVGRSLYTSTWRSIRSKLRTTKIQATEHLAIWTNTSLPVYKQIVCCIFSQGERLRFILSPQNSRQFSLTNTEV